MPLLLIEYTNLVLNEYEAKRNANRLSRLLMQPTTANIRQECLNVYNERNNKGEIEEDILRAFFGVPPAGRNFDYVIKRYPADRFRPLQSLMKREIKNPALITVELLAWLLDFKPRPLAYAKKVFANTGDFPDTDQAGEEDVEIISETDKAGINEPLEEKGFPGETVLSDKHSYENGTDLIPVNQHKKEGDFFSKFLTAHLSKRRLRTASVIGLVIIIFGLAYFFWKYKIPQDQIMGKANYVCVYWAGDHYEEVSCNEEPQGRRIITMDARKAKRFKRITRLDTITEWSIGRIYYIRDSNITKCYTEGGEYPEDINRNLRIVTRQIFENRIHKNGIANKDSLSEKN